MAKAQAEKIAVTLTTGETVEFTERQKSLKSSTLENGIAVLRFAFKNGEVREFRFDRHHDLLMRLAIHGALQKIGDETAGVEDLDDQVAAVDAVIARLEGGEWGAERTAGGSGFNGASIVIRAVAEARGTTVSEAKDFIEKKLAHYEAYGKPITRQAFYAQLRVPGSKTAPIIARLEAEKAAKKATKDGAPTADDLLND
jgi:uncharacterized small protein (DUF1192 family)